MTKEEIEKTEEIVNEMILDALSNTTQELPIEEAKKTGAVAMFGEKYGDVVRVVNFDGKSVEFCGGIHVSNTANIGSFYILKESGVSAGVRRIEAVAGYAAYQYAKSQIKAHQEFQNELKTPDVLSGIAKLKSQIQSLKEDVKSLAKAHEKELEAQEINGVKVIVETIENGDIKKIIDDAKNAYDKVAVMLFQPSDDKVTIACGVKGVSVKAGDWIKEIAPLLGGKGGGRDDFAQAGGKEIGKIDEAKIKSLDWIKGLL